MPFGAIRTDILSLYKTVCPPRVQHYLTLFVSFQLNPTHMDTHVSQRVRDNINQYRCI